MWYFKTHAHLAAPLALCLAILFNPATPISRHQSRVPTNMPASIAPDPVPVPATEATAQAATGPPVAENEHHPMPAPVLYEPPYPTFHYLPIPPPMVFPATDRDDRIGMETFMKAFGIPHGYRLAVSTSKPGLDSLKFGCSCNGKPPQEPNRSKRSGCLFRYNARYFKDEHQWRVVPYEVLHSHPADPHIKPRKENPDKNTRKRKRGSSAAVMNHTGVSIISV